MWTKQRILILPRSIAIFAITGFSIAIAAIAVPTIFANAASGLLIYIDFAALIAFIFSFLCMWGLRSGIRSGTIKSLALLVLVSAVLLAMLFLIGYVNSIYDPNDVSHIYFDSPVDVGVADASTAALFAGMVSIFAGVAGVVAGVSPIRVARYVRIAVFSIIAVGIGGVVTFFSVWWFLVQGFISVPIVLAIISSIGGSIGVVWVAITAARATGTQAQGPNGSVSSIETGDA